MLASTGDGATVIGGDGRIRFWNAAAEQILGRTSRDVLGRPCCEVFAGLDDKLQALCSSTCQIMSLVRRRMPISAFDMRTCTKAGREIWINVSVLSTEHAQGPLVVHLFRDVTAARKPRPLARTRPGPKVLECGVASRLSRREREVLHLLTEGLDNTAIAERLRVRRGTVRNHLQSIFAKLGVHTRLQAVVYASKHGLF